MQARIRNRAALQKACFLAIPVGVSLILLGVFSSLLGGVEENRVHEPDQDTTRTGEHSQKKAEPYVIVSSRVDKSVITIGEKLTYTIRIDSQEGVAVEFPTFLDNLAGLVVKDFGSSEPKTLKNKRVLREYWYILDTYTTGVYIIPPFPVKYTVPDGTEGEVKSTDIFVEVKSVMEEGAPSEDIRDIKLPVMIAVRYRTPVLLGIAAVLVLLIAIGLVIWLKGFRKKEEVVPSRPPHLIAYDELDDLLKMDLVAQGRIKEYYIRITDIVRHYIERRFNLRAPEQTTEEFLQELVHTDVFKNEYKTLLRNFLTHGDLVKFARYGPTQEEITHTYTSARTFVDSTKPQEAEEGVEDQEG